MPQQQLTHQQALDELYAFRNVIHRLYYAAIWHADRPVDEVALWTAVRDAAGFTPGNSPKELPFNGIRVELGVDKLRSMGSAIRKQDGFTSKQVEAFLVLYRDDIEVLVTKTVKDFLKRKLGE